MKNLYERLVVYFTTEGNEKYLYFGCGVLVSMVVSLLL